MAETLADVTRPPYAGRALCADVSQAHAESLAATASRVDHWILVEYRHLWTRDPVAGSGLPDEAKANLRAQLRALPNSRLLFIRRPGRAPDGCLTAFVGRSREEDRRFRRVELRSYADLARLDVPALLDDPGAEPLPHPLLVVCTHGKRDRCCAKYGRPLYEELVQEAESDWVWQSTHVGGDRFAGNLVCLPEGLYFGRLERSDVWGLLDEYLAGRIPLEHYRGRSCYPFAVQAAERRIREETGLAGIDDLRLEHWERAGDEWTVDFRATRSGELHEVDVVAVVADEPTYLTCSAPRPERPRRFLATAHRLARR